MDLVTAAMRLGWNMAELRGRSWPHGPRPTSRTLPDVPDDVLPLRHQRTVRQSRRESAQTLARLAALVGFTRAEELGTRLREALSDDGAVLDWQQLARFFIEWDALLQDDLSERDEALANGYLLGRGLAECHWGLGPEDQWVHEGEATGVSPAFLFGDDRRRELTRMLGRLEAGVVHTMTGPSIAGSLEAWAMVARDPDWLQADNLRTQLHEQARQWYQLLILRQDPSTLIKPYAKLGGLRSLGRATKLFLPQLLLSLVAVALLTAALGFAEPASTGMTSFLATGGVGTLAVAGLLTRGQSAAQRLVVRLRQDAYTDLVAISVTMLPAYPPALGGPTLRRASRDLEAAVRRRLLTPATDPPSA